MDWPPRSGRHRIPTGEPDESETARACEQQPAAVGGRIARPPAAGLARRRRRKKRQAACLLSVPAIHGPPESRRATRTPAIRLYMDGHSRERHAADGRLCPCTGMRRLNRSATGRVHVQQVLAQAGWLAWHGIVRFGCSMVPCLLRLSIPYS